MKNKLTRHHKFEKQDWWNLHYDNVLLIKDIKHRALHILFPNSKETLPLDKIDFIVDMHTSTLIKQAQEDIKTILQFWKNQWREAYNPKILKPVNIFNKETWHH